jgi:hypothetical protein
MTLTLSLCRSRNAPVGVLNELNPENPELMALTANDVAVNPGMVIRIAGVADLDLWPPGA